MSRPKGSAGFTLIELLVTMIILIILAAFAVPNFSQLIRSNRVQSVSDEFYSMLQYARTEAVTRGQQVTLTASAANTWHAALTVATTTTTLRRQGTEGFGQANVSIVSNTGTLAFRPNGSSTAAALVCFTVCPTDTSTPSCRTVQVQTSGRVLPPTTGTCP